MLTLNEDYINLQLTCEFNDIEEFKNNNAKTTFYILILHKIKRTLQIETAFQKNRIREKQLDYIYSIMDELSDSELFYNVTKINMKIKKKTTLAKE